MTPSRTRLRTIILALPMALFGVIGCTPPVVAAPASCSFIPNQTTSVDTVDLVMMIQNSNSMRDNQANLLTQLGTMVDALTNPPCMSPTNPAPHACNSGDAADVPVATAVHDLRLGVVSSDLGTPGSVVPGCANSMVGDDGLLNPIRNGGSLQMHEPWVGAPPSYPRPSDCIDPNEYPSFIEFGSGLTSNTTFTHDAQCNVGLYVNGCGLSSQLEAVYRALITHGDGAGGDSMNAGFVRPDALLAILMLTDREDESVRNCNYANGDNCPSDALDVYNSGSTSWSSANLQMRFYMYPRPGDAMDPTWPVDRYIDPTNRNRGYMSLKPGHPEMIVFGAITGMPLDPATVTTDGETHPDWDQLLGPPGAGGPDDFAGRQSAMAYTANSPEGPVSMRLANMDTTCAPDTRPVPACRRRGSQPVPGNCSTTGQYYARPARRVVEVARRFDEATWCPNGRCGNGMAASICETDDSAEVAQFVDLVRSRLDARCIGALPQVTAVHNGRSVVEVSCQMQVTLAEGDRDVCDPTLGRSDPVDPATGVSTPMHDSITGSRICVIAQVDVDATTHRPVDTNTARWFYDTTAVRTCNPRITFQGSATPGIGSFAHLTCTVPCGADGGAPHS